MCYMCVHKTTCMYMNGLQLGYSLWWLSVPPIPQVYLSLVLAMNRLARAANAKSQETKEKVITDQHIKLVFKVSIQQYELNSGVVNTGTSRLKRRNVVSILILVIQCFFTLCVRRGEQSMHTHACTRLYMYLYICIYSHGDKDRSCTCRYTCVCVYTV